MKIKLLEFQSNEGVVIIEVEDTSGGEPVMRSGLSGDNEHKMKGISPEASSVMPPKVAQSVERFENAIQAVRIIGDSVVQKMNQLTRPPNEFSIKVGLKFSGEVGAIIARTSAEGNLELSLTWKQA